jgi:hypothetical protein
MSRGSFKVKYEQDRNSLFDSLAFLIPKQNVCLTITKISVSSFNPLSEKYRYLENPPQWIIVRIKHVNTSKMFMRLPKLAFNKCQLQSLKQFLQVR